MIDANTEVRRILNAAADTKVTYYHPKEFNHLPIVSYYELSTTVGLCYDNIEQAQKSAVAVDVWGRSGEECAALAIEVDTAMQAEGWMREFSRDMPPEDGIYHKHMRFSKEIFY